MIDVGLLGALLGGVLALVSPCSAMLLPSFFAYSFDRSGLLVRRTAVFYLGMLVVLVPLGAGVGAIGSLLTRYRTTVTTVGGVVMIVLGIAMIAGLGFRFGAADRLASRITVSSGLSVFLLGTVYALAGFCSGPVLGSVLTVAAVGSQPAYGGLLMAFYALGMVLPLFVLALVWERFDLRSKRWVRGTEIRIGPLRTHTTNLISGVLFIAIGVLFVATEGTASLIGITTSDTQFDLQEWTQQVTSHVSNPIFLLVIAVVALAVVLYRLARPAAGTEAAGAEETGAAQDAKEAGDVDAVDAQGAEPVLVALATGGITALAVGVPTDVIDTPLFTRQLPVSWWEAPVVVTMAVLAAIAGGAVALRRRRAGTGEHTTVAGVLSVVGATLAVGCPVCNAVAVGVLGTAGAMSIWAPVQPVLAAASILAMGVFAVRRVRAARCGDEGCRTPVSSGGAR